jgi:hypothetical protein
MAHVVSSSRRTSCARLSDAASVPGVTPSYALASVLNNASNDLRV